VKKNSGNKFQKLQKLGTKNYKNSGTKQKSGKIYKNLGTKI
jgi:hypothetical protein